VSPYSNYNIISNKLIFITKNNSDGSINRFKDCLVIKSFH
jgi:hypothetical protein